MRERALDEVLLCILIHTECSCWATQFLPFECLNAVISPWINIKYEIFFKNKLHEYIKYISLLNRLNAAQECELSF